MKYQTTIPNSPTGNDDVSIAKSPPIILDIINNKNPLLRQFKSMMMAIILITPKTPLTMDKGIGASG